MTLKKTEFPNNQGSNAAEQKMEIGMLAAAVEVAWSMAHVDLGIGSDEWKPIINCLTKHFFSKLFYNSTLYHLGGLSICFYLHRALTH